jgi:hypothetical protein
MKPFIPRRLQLSLRRKVALKKRAACTDAWPIDERAKKPPKGWLGWPDGKRFGLVLTHDVETFIGQERCLQLAALEESYGFRSSFNFVAEGYNVSARLRNDLAARGFEVGIHGICHTGNPFRSRKIFDEQAVKINEYLKEWGSVGFRCPCMYHNLDWIGDLAIDYDSSTFDTDPFEPQPDGVGTIFPFWVKGNISQKGYVELPYTLPQDFTLFILMKEKNIDIWKKKLDWIVEKKGMALLNTHPDYMRFDGAERGIEKYPSVLYRQFLNHIRETYKDQYWHALPKEVASHCTAFLWKKQRMEG